MTGDSSTTPTPAEAPAVSVRGVYKVFGPKPGEAVRRLQAGSSRDEVKNLGTAAVIDASFDVAPGEIFVVMGLSGSGKSTLIRMLNGLWSTSAGDVFLGDENLAKVDAKQLRALRRTKVSMVFQHFALLPHRTVLDNAAYPLEIQGVAKAERMRKAQEALEMVDLGGWADSLPSQLSGGMRQRVGLARALAADTDVLLMDEAFSALDPLIRSEMQEQLLELQDKLGKTIIFITHDLNEAMHLGDRIAVMRDGRIVQIGTAEQILSDPANDYVEKFVADVDRSRVLTASTVMQRPRVTMTIGSGPRLAAREMRDADVTSAYVVDRKRVLKGLVHAEAAVPAAREGIEKLEGLIDPDVVTVHQDTPLAELFAPAAETSVPLAVLDDEGRLVGIVPRVTLLEAMAPGDNGSSDNGDSDDGDSASTDGEPTGEPITGAADGDQTGTTEGASA